MKLERCRHCHQEIDYSTRVDTWIHTVTHSVYCDLAGQDVAEPDRWGG